MKKKNGVRIKINSYICCGILAIIGSVIIGFGMDIDKNTLIIPGITIVMIGLLRFLNLLFLELDKIK